MNKLFMRDIRPVIHRYEPLPDENGGADFKSVILDTNGKPHCIKHGAMNKVSEFGHWRCIHSWKCRSGVMQTK